jgi:pimeloyl-ACP methyl ester carboxylesterase
VSQPHRAAVVLVHGFGSSSRAWAPQLAALDGRYEVHAPDLPGHGEAPGPFTLSGAARTVAAAPGGQPACLVGISGGATVALLAALDHPTAVSGLVLSAGMARPPRLLPVNRAMTWLASPNALVNSLRNHLSGGDPDHLRTATEDLLRSGKATMLAALREIAHLDVRDRLAGISVPTLVICGADDRPNLATSRELAAGIPGAELRIISGGNHLWNLQQPARFTETVDQFVDGG